MSFILANFLGPTDGANQAENSPEMKRELIEKVCAKMTDSAHLEDRRAAAQTLKSLAHSHQLEIGTFGLQALVDELKGDGEDEETAKVCLETLNVIFSPSQDEEDAGIEVQFCEIFLKNVENVQLLLDRLDDGNFYLRFTSIQLLAALAHALPAQLQTATMASPSGVSKILQLLSDEREVVRNEGILLLLRLVALNADLQKVVAFQGAFEQLLQIVVDDGGAWNGPSSVQDALNLIAALLEVNTANQIYFRDSVCFKQLAGLLGLPDDETRELWNRNRIANFEAVLSVLSKLINRENVDLEQSQNLVLNAHYLHPLLTLGFDSKIPFKVATAALETISDLIWRNGKAQAAFANAKLTRIAPSVPVRLPCSPLLAATLLALHGSSQEGLEVRLAALRCFDAFCCGNGDGQLAIISTLNPPPTQAEASIGSAISEALFDLDLARKRDPWHVWMASQLLSSCIKGNSAAKGKLLTYKLTEDEECVLNLLMINLIRISRDSRSSSHEKTVVGYFSLLTCWLEEFPVGVAAFLNEGSFLQYLIERVTQSVGFDFEIQGLGSVVLGYCVLFNDDTNTSFSSESIKGLIKNRIGPDLYISRLHRFKQSQSDLLTNLKIDFDSLTNLVAKPTPAGSSASHTATLASLSKELTSCRALLAETQTTCATATKATETLKIGILERDSYILQLQKMISDKNQRIAQLAHDLSANEQQLLTEQLKSGPTDNDALKEQNELLSSQVNQYYQQYLSDQASIEALNQSLTTMQETVQAQQERISQLEAILEGRSSTEDLDKWKKAYYELYDRIQGEIAQVAEEAEVTDLNEVVEQNGSSALSEIAEQVAQVVLNSPTTNAVEQLEVELVEPLPTVESVHAIESFEPIQPIEQIDLNSETVEFEQVPYEQITPFEVTETIVLSPSQFMSPLVSSPSTIEEVHMSDFEPEPIPEYPVASNPLPNPEQSDLYPSLPEATESNLLKPAIITAVIEAQEAPVLNEQFEAVQLAPRNTLPDVNAAVVESVYPDLPQPLNEKRASLAEPVQHLEEAKPEIEQVLEFFDNLPDEVPDSSINASFEIPAGLDAPVIDGEVPQFDYIAEDDGAGYAVEDDGAGYSEELVSEHQQSNVQEHLQDNAQEHQFYSEEQVQQAYDEQQYAEYESNETSEQKYTDYESTETSEQQYAGYDTAETNGLQHNYHQVTDTNEQQYAGYETSETNDQHYVDTEQTTEEQYPVYTEQTIEEQYYTEEPTAQYAYQQNHQEYPYDASVNQNTSSFEEHFEQVCAENQQFEQEYSTQPAQEYDYSQIYYDEATNCSYGFDQSCAQHYYYDHATGEYHYYIPASQETVDDVDVLSNPSIPDASGPPLLPLQASSSLSDSRQPDEVYSI